MAKGISYNCGSAVRTINGGALGGGLDSIDPSDSLCLDTGSNRNAPRPRRGDRQRPAAIHNRTMLWP
jgi:hypothetical protein